MFCWCCCYPTFIARLVVECIPFDLALSFFYLLCLRKRGYYLLIGAENVVLIRLETENAGEGAYEAELVVKLPHGAYLQRANSSSAQVRTTLSRH